MGTAEKAAAWALVFIMMISSAILGLGIWAFIELVTWITSK